MKRGFLSFILLLLTTINMNAQNNDTTFKSKWDEIDSLVQKSGLPKTALEKVNELYTLAAASRNEAQTIKSLLYRIRLESQITETGINQEYRLLQERIDSAFSAAQKSMLLCIQANILAGYYNMNRWKFSRRSTTVAFVKEDIETWSADDFASGITALYMEALQPENELQQTALDKYDAVILKGNVRFLRPTLYDLLAHEALDYFKSGQAWLTKPAYAFTVSEDEALAAAPEFISHSFKGEDSLSHLLIALQLMQQLMHFHSSDVDPSAFIDIDIERIVWANSNGVMENKEAFYRHALEYITEHYPDNATAQQAWFLLADTYARKAASYQPLGDTANRYAYAEALKIISSRLPAKDSSNEGIVNMLQLKNQIMQRSLKTQAEKVNVMGKPFRVLVQYRNVSQAFGRILKLDNNAGFEERNHDQDYWKKLLAQKAYKSFTQLLPVTNDFQQHNVEIKIDALPSGQYILLLSDDIAFALDSGKFAAQPFDVSSISYINNGGDYFVLNRETGQPVQQANVKIDALTYNYNTNRYFSSLVAKMVTDNNGYFKMPDDKRDRNIIEVTISTATDRLQLRENNYYRPYYYDAGDDQQYKTDAAFEKAHTSLYFFTDRSIYRPGQTVYFKGIAVTKNGSTMLPQLLQYSKTISVALQDVNRNQVDSLQLSLNEYGSFSGKFKIPQQVLTGNFAINADGFNGEADISVEEYKRPTFYVEFDTIKNSYRLGDTIHIKGKANAYAGNAADGAEVTFNVQRNTRFLYDWMSWRYPHPASPSQQIAAGRIVTGSDGSFEIIFVAKPDPAVDKKTDPVFDFNVEVSVTDSKGETRDATTNIPIGYKSMQVRLSVPPTTEVNDLQRFEVSAQNLSGENIPAEVHVTVSLLQSEKRLIRKRYWEQPDQFVFTENEYIRYFPVDEYKNETDHTTWPKKAAVVDEQVNTANTSAVKLTTGKIRPGWYVVEATARDKDGNEIKDVRYVQVYDKTDPTLPAAQYDFSAVIDDVVQPGESALAVIGTSAANIHIIETRVCVNPGNNKESKSYKHYGLRSGIKQIAVPVTEADSYGSGIFYAFVADNRYYSGGMNINVPDTTRNLDISYASWRNKTEPGSAEKWVVTVKGSNKEKAAAELLTGMYDASLDQFKRHGWQVPGIWPSVYVNNNWQGISCFAALESQEYWRDDFIISSYSKIYDQLLNTEVGWYSDTVTIADRNGNVSGMIVTRKQSMNKADAVAPPPQMELAARAPGEMKESEKQDAANTSDEQAATPVKIRSNFNETAFFFPHLYADSAGNYSFSFTMPEALTKWKWMSLAHTKQLAFGTSEQTIVTQKTLMVQPNLPRFLREGDMIEFSAKISNLDTAALTGQSTIELIDAVTSEPVDGLFQSVFPQQYFSVEAGQSTAVKFPVTIPFGYNKPLIVRIKATAGNYSDGEENTLPILTNRLLITEAIPLYLRGDTTKKYSFTKLKESPEADGDIQTQAVTVEYTTNPAWYVVQALPYISDAAKDECAEQVFNRLFINALGKYVVSKNPAIKTIMDAWKNTPADQSLLSNLQKNEELKQLLLDETPWVLEAENETAQKKNIALIFDNQHLDNNLYAALDKLMQLQKDGGSFSWYKGGPDDRYITQVIMTGIGKLQHLGALPGDGKSDIEEMTRKAMDFADAAIERDYDNLVRYKADLTKNNLTAVQVQYLFMRSYFPGNKKASIAYSYYFNQAKKYWVEQSTYLKSMIAAIMYRSGEKDLSLQKIVPSIIENAVQDKEAGMYWKDAGAGYYWYQNPLERQALIIEVMNEIAEKEKNTGLLQKTGDMQTWLIRQKQTNNWKSTKTTADACFALLVNDNNNLKDGKTVTITLGNTKTISSANTNAAAGSGYIKERIEYNKVTPAMGDISVTTQTAGGSNNQPSWGAVYWQYFQDMDKVTAAASPLSLTKKLFIERNTDAGKVIEPVSDSNELKTGDKLITRIELRSDRDMEYLHLKDMRAASMEPVNVLSYYKWQDGLGYYESTKDVATDFFISYLPKGTYVFEYASRITHEGTYSVGVASIQCMYAPEFTSHSEGQKITITK